MGDRKGENRDSPPSFRAIGFADAQDKDRKPWTLYSAGMAGLVGVAFAQLHVSKPGFKGLHEESLDTARYFPAGIINVDSHKEYFAPRTWEELLEYWRTALEKLATEFRNGHAQVDPVDNGTPCQTCDLQPLCRVRL